MRIDLRPQSRSYVAAAAVAFVGALFLLAAAWPFIDHMPLYDELLHFFAARGLLASGEPVIADGVYPRAAAFTAIVAQSLAAFGETLAAARLPALASACALLALLVVWVARRAGLLAGAAAGALLAFLPATLDLAVFARFYTLHALLVLGGAIAAFEAAAPGRGARARFGLAALAVLLAAAALRLQVTTVVAGGAVVGGLAAVLALDHRQAFVRFARRRPFALAAAALVLLAAGLAAAFALDLGRRFGDVQLWASAGAARPQYYIVELAADAPLFWPLFPVAALVALAAERRFALFALAVFGVALLVHSAAAAKSMRYLYYALPFFCAVWGIAIAGVHTLALRRGALRPLGARSAPGGATGGDARGAGGSSAANAARVTGNGVATGAAVLALVLVVTALSQEGRRAARLVLGRATTEQALSYHNETDWAPAVLPLAATAAAADRLVTSNSMKALFYFGRYDYELNASIVPETLSGEEFGVDPRTGGRAIGTAHSMADVLAMPGTALVVIEDEKLGDPNGAPADAIAAIEGRCARVPVPDTAGVQAWRCGPPTVLAEP